MPRKTRMMSIMPGDAKRRAGADKDSPRQGILSQTAEYSLRAMASIAATPDQAKTAIEIAERTGIPVHYLSKVLRRLVSAGLLVSQKGHGGGFTLARASGRIRFSDVLEAVDSIPARNRCAFGWGACDSRQPCPLHPAWSRLDAAFREWADRTTLADVSPSEGRRARVRLTLK
jgi:Rrf2 family iron-sulfur cluster assembly transcriptional regulator